ncbi:MAG: YidC/Oxa1 family membrane protein insertase [bacterium]|jgi:YidC/Oxa1 family membrane protein insertase|nr:YidC/Oxa1 family membrane protein insertase [bacterium]
MFQNFLLTPLFNALIFLYNTAGFQDLGISIILLTALIRTIFLPLFYKSTKNQILLQRLQPEIQKIQHNHKDNKEKQAQAIMDLYKKHDVNPLSGFLMILIQLPVLIAIYQVFLNGFAPETFSHLYSFITKPEYLNTTFLGLIDLQKRSILMVSLAAIAQCLQAYQMLPKKQKGQELSAPEQMGRQMAFISPLLTVLILFNLPGAIGIYWLVTSVYSIIQQVYINKTLDIKTEKREHHLIK